MRNIWIIGSSSGIGLELAKQFLLRGDKIIASSRNATNNKELLELQRVNNKNLNLLDIDISNQDSIESSYKKLQKICTNVDIFIYNAAIYDVISLNDFDVEKIKKMNDINYLGFIRVMGVIIPFFRKQGYGRVVVNCSISSYFGLPYGGAYSASKSALLNFAQSIQPELITENIELQVINHGFVKTRLTKKNDFEMPQLLEVNEAAKNIIKGIEKPYRFEISFPFIISMVLKLLNILPYRFSLYLTRKMLR